MVKLLALSVLLGLATWRLASLLHTEDAFEWLRKRIGIGNDEQGFPAMYPDSFWGGIFSCFWCLATVVALPVALLGIVLARQNPLWWPVLWLASSAVAIWLEKQVMRSRAR